MHLFRGQPDITTLVSWMPAVPFETMHMADQPHHGPPQSPGRRHTLEGGDVPRLPALSPLTVCNGLADGDKRLSITSPNRPGPRCWRRAVQVQVQCLSAGPTASRWRIPLAHAPGWPGKGNPSRYPQSRSALSLSLVATKKCNIKCSHALSRHGGCAGAIGPYSI